MIATFDGYEIPGVARQIDTFRTSEDTSTSSTNYLLKSVAGNVKREWEIRCNRSSEIKSLLNHLYATNFAAGDFWLDEFGDITNTVTAYIEVRNAERFGFYKAGEWINDAKEVVLIVREK